MLSLTLGRLKLFGPPTAASSEGRLLRWPLPMLASPAPPAPPGASSEAGAAFKPRGSDYKGRNKQLSPP